MKPFRLCAVITDRDDADCDQVTFFNVGQRFPEAQLDLFYERPLALNDGDPDFDVLDRYEIVWCVYEGEPSPAELRTAVIAELTRQHQQFYEGELVTISVFPHVFEATGVVTADGRVQIIDPAVCARLDAEGMMDSVKINEADVVLAPFKGGNK